MSEGCWELNKPLELNEIANNSFSVLSVFSVVKSVEFVLARCAFAERMAMRHAGVTRN